MKKGKICSEKTRAEVLKELDARIRKHIKH